MCACVRACVRACVCVCVCVENKVIDKEACDVPIKDERDCFDGRRNIFR